MPEEPGSSNPADLRHVCPFRPGHPIITDYGNIYVAGYPLNLWLTQQELNLLQSDNSIRYGRQVVYWHMIHICLSFYHSRGHSFPEEDLVLLQKLLDHFIPGLTASITPRFVYLLYCYVVGIYGCFESTITYGTYIGSCIELEHAGEEYVVGFDPDQIDNHRNPLPFPSQ